MLTPLLLALPWVAFAALAAVRLRGLPEGLPEDVTLPADPPPVSVVVPARNEAENIARCLESVAASDYPAFEIIVVDDRSGDGTGKLARSVAPGGARRVAVLDGEPVPEGWLGKSWACWQGARVATGEVLLFTDADTVHGRDLLVRTVADLERTGADAHTVAGRQIAGSFWERVVQPQVFALLLLRFGGRMKTPLPRERWRDAIANGQYLLFRRRIYEAVGGHRAVRGEVVEDLRLAQILVREGHRLMVREAEDALATRMYRSLGGLLEGWTKNLATGVRQSVPPVLRPVVAPVAAFAWGLFWLAPPLALLAGVLGFGGPSLLLWSGTASGVGALVWGAASRRMKSAPVWGLFYPLGAAVAAFILLRSWVRGSRVEWKGRRYRIDRE